MDEKKRKDYSDLCLIVSAFSLIIYIIVTVISVFINNHYMGILRILLCTIATITYAVKLYLDRTLNEKDEFSTFTFLSCLFCLLSSIITL